MATSPDDSDDEPKPGGRSRPRFSRAQLSTGWMLLLCQFLVILDTTGFNVTLAAIAREFDVPASQASAINLGFAVTVAMMIPLSGWLGERLGTVRILVASLAMIILGAAICAASVGLPMLVAGRIVQGVGGGGLVPLAASLMYRNFEPMHRLRVMMILSMPISLAPAIGPLIGGFFVDYLSWRGVFLLIIPIAASAVVVGLFFADEVSGRAVRPLDVRGAILTIVGFGATVLGLQQLAAAGDTATGLVSLVVGLAAIALLVPFERRMGDRAFLDLGLFAHRTFAKTTSIIAVHSIGFMGFGLAGPLLLQTELGLTAFQAGLIGVANALGPFVASRFARPFIVRVGPRTSVALSQAGIIVSLGVVVLGYAVPALWVIAIGMFVFGASTFVTVVACQTVGFAVIPHANLGDATALEATARQLGGALAIAIVSATLASAASFGASMMGTVGLTIGVLALFHVIALVILAGPGRLPLPPRPDAAREETA